MSKVSKYINSVIASACLDERVASGFIDINNIIHREVIAEHLIDFGLDVTTVTEIVNELAIRDGKYPDRQAYNKEGWLVTFPSPEYKNAAIKKGTHFASDPTHGKGGMNIYYKRKGKQKRMAQQDPTQVDPNQQQNQQPAPPPAQAPVSPQAPAPTTPPPTEPNQSGNEPDGGAADGGNSSLPPSDDSADDVKTPQSAKDYEAGPKGGDQKPAGGQDAQAPQPTPSAPPPPSFTNISVEFAKGKQWNPASFGEWRTITGETAAVVGLGGEVVPIKSTDREELKLFAAKKQK